MALTPFLLQGLIMGVDEFYCHRRRRLRRWERVGHPLDTLTFLLSLSWLRMTTPGPLNVMVFMLLAGFSCLFITKDEWQHKELCTAFENWLHALLFLIHPLVLLWAAWLWWTNASMIAVNLAVALAIGFLLYQTIYWRAWRRD